MTKVSKCCNAMVQWPVGSKREEFSLCCKCYKPCDLIDQPETKEQKKNEGLKGWELLADDDILYAEHFSSGVHGGLIDYDASVEQTYTSRWLHSDGFKVTKRKSDEKKLLTDTNIQILETILGKEIEMVSGFGTEWVKLADYNQLQKQNESLKAELQKARDELNNLREAIKSVIGLEAVIKDIKGAL